MTWRYDYPDDELLPILECECGRRFSSWEMNIGVYSDDPTTMPCCGRRVYFSQKIEVIELSGGTPKKEQA